MHNKQCTLTLHVREELFLRWKANKRRIIPDGLLTTKRGIET